VAKVSWPHFSPFSNRIVGISAILYIQPSTPRSHKWSIPFRLFDQNFVCIYILWNDRLTHWHHFTHINVRKLQLISWGTKFVLHASDKLWNLIRKCIRQRSKLINYFDFFKLVISVTGGHYEDSLRAPENMATSLVKCFLVQALRLCTGRTAHRGTTGIALLFLDHGTRRGWGVSVTPRPLFTPGKDPVPIVQEAGWAPGPVWTGAENLVPHRDSIPGPSSP